ncbi:MAG TPA: DUF937 domain-containing protein [Roseiarcus sp.]|nr:DUF937 domain-containing protein [Roseiarcus sp.]
MAIDLVGLVSQFLTPQLVGSLARAVGINEAAAQKLVSAAIPVVLGALATTAAAPGGAQKLVDAVSNSDPDLLTKLSGAISGGNVGPLNQGANWLGGLLGGSGLSSIAGALGQFSGAPQGAAQSAIGAVAQSAIGAIGREDPSNWSDPASIAAMFGAQKNAIAAALPGELSRALGATGLLTGLGALGAPAARTARPTASSPPRAPSPPISAAPSRTPAPRSPGAFPMWAIILLIVIALAAISWWLWTSTRRVEPVKTGMLQAPIEFTLTARPGPQA